MHLEVRHIVKSFAKEQVLKDISFSLEDQQTFSILGKSGCGKTTLLKILAGLVPSDGGDVFLDRVNINHLNARQRNMVYISQEALLFPHLDVFENIAFGLRIRKQENAVVSEKVNRLIEELGLASHRHKKPDQLSGGQKQRVNFGRALIVQPPLLFLDEPFGNLDIQTRQEMQALFQQIIQEHAITSIFVTHDLREALVLGDKIGFMEKGNLKTYPDKISFITDSATGVGKEIAFWKSFSNE
jgi:ABC-type sugar transport system ATPase subunit